MGDEKEAPATRRIPEGFWGIAALVVWALAATMLLERSGYGLDEATARAVLFLWSISDQVASPIVALGIPDIRSAYLAPAGIFFSGSLLAVKLCTLVVTAAGALALYRMCTMRGDTESPLPATGLYLLSPIALSGIDHIAIGPFLVLTFLAGSIADASYRAHRMRFGGAYFAQLVLCIAAISLHPCGLAYPIVLAVSWIRERSAGSEARSIVPGRERTHVLAGIGLATLGGALLAAGWPHQQWFANPVTALTAQIFDFQSESSLGDVLSWIVGTALLLALGATAWRMRTQLRTDRLGATLLVAIAIAAAAGDESFALLTLAVLLYWGFPGLLHVRLSGARGFLAQRGAAMGLLFVCMTAFLVADRANFARIRQGPELSEQDRLIHALSVEVARVPVEAPGPGLVPEEEKARRGVRVASQWPGRTMIACRCSTLPLPPPGKVPEEDAEAFLAQLRGIDFVVFDPKDPDNRILSRQFATLGGASAETVVLEPAGVLLRLHPGVEPQAPHAPPAGQSGLEG